MAAARNFKSKFIPTAFMKVRRAKKFVPIEFRRTRTKSNPVWVSVSSTAIPSSAKQTSGCLNTDSLRKCRSLTQFIQHRPYSKGCNVGCPCPFPCGPCGGKDGCNCLPPPCNTPPKCLQYMTGYYYYPYGTWFCGPYHVQGTCCPVGSKAPCPCACPCPKCACLFPTAGLGAETTKPEQKPKPNVRIFSYDQPKQSDVQPASGISKIFNFKTPEQKDQKEDPKPTKKNVPPVLASMLSPNLTPMNNKLPHPNIKPSYPISSNKTKSNSYHTKAAPWSSNQLYRTPIKEPRRDRFIYYPKRYKVTRPLEFNIVLRDHQNKLGLFNCTPQPRFKKNNPKPHVDANFKPYDF
ncbi:unnamed protein product [Danaus chrysippus]|uniref:(African queen) hypothetical protein n=1 Tax=Danaus chrysippus TaxID=151541 RepID=A0A8J2QXZ8_9NEOP|nr:unnamed protein product [Danaus chrysippus]